LFAEQHREIMSKAEPTPSAQGPKPLARNESPGPRTAAKVGSNAADYPRRRQNEPKVLDFQLRTKDLERQSWDKKGPKEDATPQAHQPQFRQLMT